MSGLRIVPIGEDRLPAAHAVLLLAGEHMDRAQGMSHWWPWMPLDAFVARAAGRDTVLAVEDDVVVGTWSTSTLPEPYDDPSLWPDRDVTALHLSGLGVLPGAWGRGVGGAALDHAVAVADQRGLDRVRFDAVSTNEVLLRWYERHGCAPVGRLEVRPGVHVTLFERLLGT